MPIVNPFKPGAGHMPPHLAGRKEPMAEFRKLLTQDVVIDNLVITGLRGVGKTVFLEALKVPARESGWLWVGTDLSESSSVSEETLAHRIITDLAVVTSAFVLRSSPKQIGFGGEEQKEQPLNYRFLLSRFQEAPGLVADKLKAVLELVGSVVRQVGAKGILFAYDEAQTMSDHAKKDEYPLSLLLDVFQSIQKKDHPLMLVLVGLPTLFPQLVEARTFAERMFRIIVLDRLSEKESQDAILKPLKDSTVKFDRRSVSEIVESSRGYPYFIQFMCREAFEVLLVRTAQSLPSAPVPLREIIRKLDSEFFAGRWARVTDRQRDLLYLVAQLESCEAEFTVQQITDSSKNSAKPFSSSHVNQMLSALIKSGLVYKNRHGRYAFAVPLLGDFIIRQMASDQLEFPFDS